MRILTAQSQEVLDLILQTGEYRPDYSMRRCQNDDYSVDAAQLGGQTPIYGVKLTDYDYMVEAYNGWMIQRHLEILRVFDEAGYGRYRFLELEVPDYECFYSKYHNGGNEWVFSVIRRDYLLSAFRLHEYPDELHKSAWYYRRVEVLFVGSVRPVLYEENFDTLEYNLVHEAEIDALERKVEEMKRAALRAFVEELTGGNTVTGQDKYKRELETLTPVFQACVEPDVEFTFAVMGTAFEGSFGITKAGVYTSVLIRCLPESSVVTVSSGDLCDFCGGPYEAMELFDSLIVELIDFARRVELPEVLVLGQAFGAVGESVLFKRGYIKEPNGRAYAAKVGSLAKAIDPGGVQRMTLGGK